MIQLALGPSDSKPGSRPGLERVVADMSAALSPGYALNAKPAVYLTVGAHIPRVNR